MSDILEDLPTEERLKELLVGKSIVSGYVTNENPIKHEAGPSGRLILNDGTILIVWGNDGGCACDAGCYPLAQLASSTNMITNVEVEAKPDFDNDCEECKTYDRDCPHRGFYRIFVVANDERVQLASFEGSDGNGYYGTGWWLAVRTEEAATPSQEKQGV